MTFIFESLTEHFFMISWENLMPFCEESMTVRLRSVEQYGVRYRYKYIGQIS